MKITFGRYKNQLFEELPNGYLKYLIDNNIAKGKLLIFGKTKLNYPKTKYKIIVEDSVGQDGEYFEEAYSKEQAIKQCQKNNKIQNTQSFCGTSYSTIII